MVALIWRRRGNKNLFFFLLGLKIGGSDLEERRREKKNVVFFYCAKKLVSLICTSRGNKNIVFLLSQKSSHHFVKTTHLDMCSSSMISSISASVLQNVLLTNISSKAWIIIIITTRGDHIRSRHHMFLVADQNGTLN